MRRVGITGIAQRANVSIATAERALNGRPGVSAATRDKVLQIARKVGYRPNLAASRLARQRPEVRIGVCIPREMHVFFDQIRAGAEAEASRFEHEGVCCISQTPAHMEDDAAESLQLLLDARVDALLVCPGTDESTSLKIREAEQAGIPVVCCSNDLPLSGRSTAVLSDSATAAAMAAEILTRLNPQQQRVIIQVGVLEVASHSDHASAFHTFVRERCPQAEIQVVQGHDDPVLTYQLMDEVLNQSDITGIYVATANCMPVCHLLHARQQSLRCPLVTTDVFPEMKPFIQDKTIAASLYQHPYRQGRQGMRALIDLLLFRTTPQTIYKFAPELVLSSNFGQFLDTQNV